MITGVSYHPRLESCIKGRAILQRDGHKNCVNSAFKNKQHLEIAQHVRNADICPKQHHSQWEVIQGHTPGIITPSLEARDTGETLGQKQPILNQSRERVSDVKTKT